ncbi:MAG: hypothetical protein AB1797_10420 [bacterium]
MKRLSLILSLIFLVSLSASGYAGVNLGMTGAVKERAEKLDEKAKVVKEPTEEEKEEAKKKVEEANGSLEEAMDSLGESQEYGDENYEKAMDDLEEANSFFKEALEKDPNNPEANLGAAITEIILIGEDPEIKEAMEKLWAWLESFGENFMGSPIFMPKRLQAPPKDKAVSALAAIIENEPLTMSELQDITKDKVLPKIDYITKRLEVVENSSWESTTFEFTLDSEAIKDFISSNFNDSEEFNSIEEMIDEIFGTFANAGNGETFSVEIDKTDVYLYDGVLQLLKSVLSGFCAWNLDIVYDDFEDPEKIKTAIMIMKIVEKQSPYDKFLTLKDSGMLEAAGNALDASAAKWLTAIESLENETDDQQNDLLPKPEDLDEDGEKMKYALNQLREALRGTTTIDFTYYDPESTLPELKINLNAFYFTNQMQDLRDYFIPAVEAWPWDPPYSEEPKFEDIDDDGLTPDWNDPTFNGVFPGMTNEKLKEYFEALAFFEDEESFFEDEEMAPRR